MYFVKHLLGVVFPETVCNMLVNISYFCVSASVVFTSSVIFLQIKASKKKHSDVTDLISPLIVTNRSSWWICRKGGSIDFCARLLNLDEVKNRSGFQSLFQHLLWDGGIAWHRVSL